MELARELLGIQATAAAPSYPHSISCRTEIDKTFTPPKPGDPYQSLTTLCVKYGVKLSPCKVNRILQAQGFIALVHRENAEGRYALPHYALTEKGWHFGRQVAKHQSNKPKIYWREALFPKLLDLILNTN